MMPTLVPKVTMKTALWFMAFAGIAMLLPLRAAADPTPTPNVYRSLEAGNAHDAGVVRGTIDSVDYASGSISVRSARMVLVVTIVPSTAIYRGRQYATLSDLRRGETVTANVYTIDGRLVARSVELK